jgi:hypothetical protein
MHGYNNTTKHKNMAYMIIWLENGDESCLFES